MLVKGVDENNPTAAFRMGMAQLRRGYQPVGDGPASVVQRRCGRRVNSPGRVTRSITPSRHRLAGHACPERGNRRRRDRSGRCCRLPIPTAELLPFFYSERGLTVRTAIPLTISVDQATQIIIDTIKGGGGGYGEGGIFEVRQEFVDTPLWSPNLVTDENGAGDGIRHAAG